MLEEEDGPSLALLDWTLPGMDGVEICRRVRSSVRGRPVYLVLLTGRAQQEDVVHGLEAGAELRSRLRVGDRVLEMTGQLQERVSELVQALARLKQLEAMVAGSSRT
jgi:phosphoserine phosphatase RsbU/P